MRFSTDLLSTNEVYLIGHKAYFQSGSHGSGVSESKLTKTQAEVQNNVVTTARGKGRDKKKNRRLCDAIGLSASVARGPKFSIPSYVVGWW